MGGWWDQTRPTVRMNLSGLEKRAIGICAGLSLLIPSDTDVQTCTDLCVLFTAKEKRETDMRAGQTRAHEPRQRACGPLQKDQVIAHITA